MKLFAPILLASASLALMGTSAANAAALLHYTFSADSFYTYSGSPDTPVSGSFDFDTVTGLLSNVDYNSVSGHFTTGAEYTPGDATQIYFGTMPGNYDVFQLASSLTTGGTVQISSGTHPAIFISAGGSLVAGAAPEPSSWALMLGGFGAIGTALRRRRDVAVSFV